MTFEEKYKEFFKLNNELKDMMIEWGLEKYLIVEEGSRKAIDRNFIKFNLWEESKESVLFTYNENYYEKEIPFKYFKKPVKEVLRKIEDKRDEDNRLARIKCDADVKKMELKQLRNLAKKYDMKIVEKK